MDVRARRAADLHLPELQHGGPFLMELLTYVTYACSLIMTAYTVYFFVIALFSVKKPKQYPRAAPRTRFAVLVAARNEEAVIGGLVESLMAQRYTRELYDVVVVPNNCTDATGPVAARAGGTVLPCTVPTSSKGEVLDFALNRIFRWKKRYDAVCVFDADNLVHPDFLARMNDAYQAGARVAQAYRDSKNPTDTPISGCYSIYYWMVNRFYSQARAAIGLNAIINGSGFMVSMEILREQGGWKTATITEDIEFSALCALKGRRIWWVPEAVTFDEQPLTFAQSWKQRKRWSTGMVQCMERYSGALLGSALRGNLRSFDSLMFFLVPVIQVLGLLAVAGSGVFELSGIRYGLFPRVDLFYQLFFAVNVSFMTTFAGAFLAVVANGKAVWPMLRGMVWYWVFIMSWMPLNLLCLVKRSTTWEAIPHTRAIRLSGAGKPEGQVLPGVRL